MYPGLVPGLSATGGGGGVVGKSLWSVISGPAFSCGVSGGGLRGTRCPVPQPPIKVTVRNMLKASLKNL